MSKRAPKNQLLRYGIGITKVIISVHAEPRQRFNHARVLFRRADETTLLTMTAQRHRLDLPDALSSSLYAPKPNAHDRPEAPFDFGEKPFSCFYGMKVEEIRQVNPFDTFALERATKIIKRLHAACGADEVRASPVHDELVLLVRVLERVTHTPIEWNLTLDGISSVFTPYTMPYAYVGKSYKYWAEQRGEEPLAQHCPKCNSVIGLLSERPTPDLCGVCYAELGEKERIMGAQP